ncbi:MAG: radical SAM protein [Clostridia bacterium]|nr:radical SAM protein [Clostridia bacterium]
MERYSIINDKNPREIVLLRGKGCIWRQCTFCDYHLDSGNSEEENYRLNSEVLAKVKGMYGRLEAINSGSFCELDQKTLNLITDTCIEKKINTLHFESHIIYKNQAVKAKKELAEKGIRLIIKTGVETFDKEYREHIMKKGFGLASPKEIAEYANEVCLLFGLSGQTEQSMLSDIETGLQYFDRVCVNIMNENSTKIKPDSAVINIFAEKIAPLYTNNDRVDILMDNLDFGVGTKVQEVSGNV